MLRERERGTYAFFSGTSQLATDAARAAQQTNQAQATIEQVLASNRPMSTWMRRSLGMAPSTPTHQRR